MLKVNSIINGADRRLTNNFGLLLPFSFQTVLCAPVPLGVIRLLVGSPVRIHARSAAGRCKCCHLRCAVNVRHDPPPRSDSFSPLAPHCSLSLSFPFFSTPSLPFPRCGDTDAVPLSVDNTIPFHSPRCGHTALSAEGTSRCNNGAHSHFHCSTRRRALRRCPPLKTRSIHRAVHRLQK